MQIEAQEFRYEVPLESAIEGLHLKLGFRSLAVYEDVIPPHLNQYLFSGTVAPATAAATASRSST